MYFISIGTIVIKLYDLGQMYLLSFHKLLKLVGRNFGPFLLTELVFLKRVYMLPGSHMHFQLCPLRLDRIQIKALWWSLQNGDFGTTLEHDIKAFRFKLGYSIWG